MFCLASFLVVCCTKLRRWCAAFQLLFLECGTVTYPGSVHSCQWVPARLRMRQFSHCCRHVWNLVQRRAANDCTGTRGAAAANSAVTWHSLSHRQTTVHKYQSTHRRQRLKHRVSQPWLATETILAYFTHKELQLYSYKRHWPPVVSTLWQRK